MELTPVGWVLIPLGLFSFLFQPKFLLPFAVFSIPFSATAIINKGSGDSASGYSPYLFFGFLLLVRKMVDVIVGGARSGGKFRIPRSIELPLALLLLFAFVCLLSLVMPALIGGQLYIMSSPNSDYNLVPLQYSPQILAHSLSLIFEILMTVFIARLCLDPKFFKIVLRTYLLSGVFVSLWGWMQFLFYLFGFRYPAYIFNNNASPYAAGYESVVDSINILRVSSVALEPSFLARILIAMSAMCLMAVYNRSYIFGKFADTSILFLFVSTIVITTSSTGYVGAAALIILLMFMPSSYRRRKMIAIAFVLVIVGAIAILYFTIPAVAEMLDWVIFDKSAAGSVVERQLIINNDMQYFLRYPLLGVGWDCAPTHDLVIGMLANCGLLGLSLFSLLIGSITWRLQKYGSLLVASENNPAAMMLLCLLGTCIVFGISGGIEPPEFWLVLALAIAAAGMGQNANTLFGARKGHVALSVYNGPRREVSGIT